MKGKHYILTILLCLCAATGFCQEAMNRPYIDDRLYHFGFQVGMNFTAFGVTDSEIPVTTPKMTDTLHSRVSNVIPGVHVNFIADLRLSRHVNLRFTPGIQFSSRTITFSNEKSNIHSFTTNDRGEPMWDNAVDVWTIPVNFPLYLKFSADRQSNYRPYVIAGGGVCLNINPDTKKPVTLKLDDYFCEVGFGVDFYLPWFKLCPELTYRIGFSDILCPSAERIKRGDAIDKRDYFYTNAISHLYSHCICLTFNFE